MDTGDKKDCKFLMNLKETIIMVKKVLELWNGSRMEDSMNIMDLLILNKISKERVIYWLN